MKESTMDDFKPHGRKQIAELRPVTTTEIEAGLAEFISMSPEDKKNGSPKPGDMIARNPKNHKDQWLVAKAYYEDNFDLMEDQKKAMDDSMLVVHLKHIVENSKGMLAPSKLEFYSTHYEYLIGIGCDHTASIFLDQDALNALHEIIID